MNKTKTKTKKTKLELAEDKKLKLLSYTRITDKIFFKEMPYKAVTNKMREELQLLKKYGVTVVIVDGKRHRPYLAPGQDPYEVRRITTEKIKSLKDSKIIKSIKNTTKKSSGVKVSKTISI